MDLSPSPGSHRCDPTSPRKRGEVKKASVCQSFFALLGCELNSFFKSSMLCESRGHSQENAFLAQLEALMRSARLTGLATGTGIFSVSVRSDTCWTPCCNSC